jgi:hypothetical protein
MAIEAVASVMLMLLQELKTTWMRRKNLETGIS